MSGGGESVVLLNELSGKLTLKETSEERSERDEEIQRIPGGRALQVGRRASAKPQGRCLPAHLRKSQDDRK